MAQSLNNNGIHCTAAEGGIGIMRGVSGQNHERKQRSEMGIRGGGSWLRSTLAMLLVMSCVVGRSYALDIAYCSDVNTSSDSKPMTNTWQSNGLCHDYCLANYAFAIVQGSKCWCSNYIPSTETTGCTQICPGYDSEQCGNTSKGLFGYIALTNSPSGTSGPSSTVRTTSSPLQTSASSSPIDTTSAAPPPPPSISTVVEVKPGPTKTLIITATPSTTSSKSSSTTSSDTTTSSTSTTSLSPSLTVITEGGIRTVTYTPESTASSTATASAAASTSNGGFFSQPGRVAGLFIGIAIIIIGLVAGLLFLYYRRNRRRDAMNGGSEAGGGIIPAGGAGVMASRRRSRSLSTLGLIGGEKGFHSVSTAPATGPPNMAGLNGIANSVARGPDGTKLVDQRLDPNQLYLRYDPDTGSSRMSVRSLRDDADYSRRVLRLANPDD